MRISDSRFLIFDDRRRERGSALLLVLWAIILLTSAILAWTTYVESDLEFSADRNLAVEAKAMAHSGIALGLHPLVSEKTPGLEEEVNAQLGFRVRIIGEGGKLNINTLLTGEQPEKLDLLGRWLEGHGYTYQEREAFVDCLLDWVDQDEVKHLNGAEAEEGYTPPNRGSFESVDEIEQVRGAGPLLRSKGWKEEITVFGGGMVDLSSATEAVLKLLPGLGEAQIQRFLQVRRGRDQIDGTIDDQQFKTLQEIQSYLGMSQAQFKPLSGLVVVKDQTQRIISEGRSSNVVRQVEVVARKGGANPQIQYWKE
jgi:general secretion pathway protein K